MRWIDLNADIGEGAGEDEALLAVVTTVNIACGGHAGDEVMMRATLKAAAARGVKAGAHPGYEDRAGFGRREKGWGLEAIEAAVAGQVGWLRALADEVGVALSHVKPHGALYHRVWTDEAAARAVVKGMKAAGGPERVLAPEGSALAEVARAAGLVVWREGFVDRGYGVDGRLLPRGAPGAELKTVAEGVVQAVRLARGGGVESLCVHGDIAGAAVRAAAVRAGLEAAGFGVGRGGED